MIIDEDHLASTRKILANLEAALDSMRQDVKPKSETWYRVMSEPVIDLMLDLRDEIDTYLGIKRSVANAVPVAPQPMLEPAHAG